MEEKTTEAQVAGLAFNQMKYIVAGGKDTGIKRRVSGHSSGHLLHRQDKCGRVNG